MNIHKIIVLLVFLALITGCASFSSKSLPIRSYAEFTSPVNNKKINSMEYDIFIQINDKHISDFSVYKGITEEVFSKSAVFDKISMGKENAGYHLYLNPKAYYSPMGFAMACGISVGTLGIMPTTLSINYILDVTLSNNGKILKTYSYSEKSRTWFHLSMLFVPKQKPQIVDKQIIENMLLNLLLDLKKDGYI